MSDQKTVAALTLDRAGPVGASLDPSGRYAMWVKAGTGLAPIDYDQGVVTYPNSTTEVYTYKKAGVTLRTVTITYTNASKSFISGWVIT